MLSIMDIRSVKLAETQPELAEWIQQMRKYIDKILNYHHNEKNIRFNNLTTSAF